MVGKGPKPGERRRRRGKSKKKTAKPEFTRPVEWAVNELAGVLSWIDRLDGPEAQYFPTDWAKGQLKHYRTRAKVLRAEIRAHKRREKEAKAKAEPDPSAA